MESIKINNTTYAVKIHQREEQLPWLLMLHGFMGDHRVFDHMIEDLCESCNPVGIDLLGHGKSAKPKNPARYDETNQINDIVGIIQKLNIFPLFLYGYSMGGRLALKTAFANNELFRGLILESTTNGIEDNRERKQRQQTDRHRADQIESDYKKFLSKWEEAALFQSPVPPNQKLVKKYHKIHQEQVPKAMAASLRGFGTGFMTPETEHFPGFNKPTLLIAGSGDEKYKQINNQLTSFFSNVHLCFIEAGHRVHLDNPTNLIQELKNHIDQNLPL